MLKKKKNTENGSFEGWPLIAFPLDLPPKLRGKFTNLIFLAYWYSPEKPNWDYIFKEMDIRPYFAFENINYRLTFLQVIADIPAKQHLLNMLNVNGYNCCPDCDIKGEHKNRTMTFPYAELNPRDPRTFMVKNKTIQGVKGLSVLRNHLEIFPEGAIIDVMHSVYKGPMEDDLKKLINGFKFNETDTRLIKLDKIGKELLEKVLSNTTFTKEYQRRRVRSLDMFANWKASELKLFMLYVIPAVFVYLSSSQLPKVQLLLDSMVKYMAAIRLLVSSKINSNMISAASNILKEWASQRAPLWGDKAMTFKTHQALHLSEQVIRHGPLSTHSAFAGESAIGKIGKNISCYTMEVSVNQICERMAMEHASLTWIQDYSQSDLKQMFKLVPINSTRKTQQPSEDLETFLKSRNTQYILHGEITICGYCICPFWKSGSSDCYVAAKTTTGYEPLKVMAIIEEVKNEILLCCKLLNTKPYSTLMCPEGILADQVVYEYCCYGKVEDFEKDGYVLCNAQSFLAKYSKIAIEEYNFLITLPHPYEHN